MRLGSTSLTKWATRLTFWLLKEGSERARKAEVELPVEADRRCDLTVSVRQTPGQGFAEVQISSSDFEALRRSPITLDWVSMEEVDRSRDDILGELRDQTQTGAGGRMSTSSLAIPYCGWIHTPRATS